MGLMVLGYRNELLLQLKWAGNVGVGEFIKRIEENQRYVFFFLGCRGEIYNFLKYIDFRVYR